MTISTMPRPPEYTWRLSYRLDGETLNFAVRGSISIDSVLTEIPVRATEIELAFIGERNVPTFPREQ